MPIVDWSGQTILSVRECEFLLGRVPVGRIAFLHDGMPRILPVNFIYRPGEVLFRTGVGSKLEIAIMERPVCFEVDGWDAIEHVGWSVVVSGSASTVDDEARLASFAHLALRPWSTPAVRHRWVEIRADEITGRRVGPDQHALATFVDPRTSESARDIS